MKLTKVFIICLLAFCCSITAKDILPQEMIFVHMDNTCYFLGDTLFYKVYVQRSDTGKPTDISEVAYAELLNQDGYLVERQMLRLNGGQANSQFCLEDTAYAGFYELRVYTRWQLNWGRYEHPHNKLMNKWFLKKEYAAEYFTDYEKLYSRVFPVYDKPQNPGEFYRDMTARPLRRDYKPENESRDANVTLYPEGGELIAGCKQRIAFEASNDDGKHLDGHLTVINDAGDTVATAVTENRGRGVLEYTFKSNEKEKVLFVDTCGQITKVKLPQIQPTGVAMTIQQSGNSVHADVQTRGISIDSLSMIVRCRGVNQVVLPITLAGVDFSTESFPSGVVQLMLTDPHNQVYSDRLIFVWNDDIAKGHVDIDGVRQELLPLSKHQLQLKGRSNGIVSLAVRDRINSDAINDDGNILSEMLLCSQIKGFVEQPTYYFSSNDELHRRHLDLLLMVQGWRRFRNNSPEIVEPYEKSPIIQGDVSNYIPLDQEDDLYISGAVKTDLLKRGICGPIPVAYAHQETLLGMYAIGNPPQWYSQPGNNEYIQTTDFEFLSKLQDRVYMHAEFWQTNVSPLIGDMELSADGKFNIMAPNFNGYCFFELTAASKAHVHDKESYQWILPNSDNSADLSVRLHQFYPRFPISYSFYQTEFPKDEWTVNSEDVGQDNLWKFGDITTLKEIQIKNRRRILRKLDLSKPAFVLDAYDAFNQIVDAGMTSAFYAGSMTFSCLLSQLIVGDMGVKRGYDMERRWNGRTIEVNSIKSHDEQILYNHLTNLDKVYIYTDYSPREEGRRAFRSSNQPSVTIDIHRYMDDSTRPTYRDRFYLLDGYSTPIESYHPDYSKRHLPEGQKDYRRTLYWNPNLQLDENGEATITFYNNSRSTHLSVEAEGQAADGTLLWGKEE